MSELNALYQQKGDYYFSDAREELVELVNRTGLTVLEVGCGNGATGKRLLETGKAKWVTGVELVPEQGAIARSVLNEVYVGNINDIALDWQPRQFDCFVFGDVIEHFADPWSLLRRLRPFLAEDGIVVTSIPNVRHWPVVWDLVVRGDWRYQKDGVMDITHLRFFTRKSIYRFFAETGYAVQVFQPYFNGRRYSIPNQITFGALMGFLSQRWLMRLQAA